MRFPESLPRFRIRWWRAILLGLPGILVLPLQIRSLSMEGFPPEVQQLSPAALAALSLVNPLVLLVILAAVGAALAHRVGLKSLIIHRPAGTPVAWSTVRRSAWLACLVGLAVAIAIQGLDRLSLPYLGAEWAARQSQAKTTPHLQALAIGVLYGGFTEEILARWGVMSLVVWLASRWLASRMASSPGPARGSATEPVKPVVAWIGILVAGVLFAAGHLPALGQGIELTPALVGRTMALNLVAAIAYGWLFWRRNLESAIVAHAFTHVGFALSRVF